MVVHIILKNVNLWECASTTKLLLPIYLFWSTRKQDKLLYVAHIYFFTYYYNYYTKHRQMYESTCSLCGSLILKGNWTLTNYLYGESLNGRGFSFMRNWQTQMRWSHVRNKSASQQFSLWLEVTEGARVSVSLFVRGFVIIRGALWRWCGILTQINGRNSVFLSCFKYTSHICSKMCEE